MDDIAGMFWHLPRNKFQFNIHAQYPEGGGGGDQAYFVYRDPCLYSSNLSKVPISRFPISFSPLQVQEIILWDWRKLKRYFCAKTKQFNFTLLRILSKLIELFLGIIRRKVKELILCHKLKYYKPYIFATWWCKPLIFQT